MGRSGARVLLGGGTSWDHRDPFDRLIGAHVVEPLPLVTRDPVLDTLPGVRAPW